MKITAERQTITAAQAEAIIVANANSKNRNHVNNHVNFLTSQIKAGQWVFNGVPIVFDANGKLVDGQHRLRACSASGMSIDVMVVKGVGDDAFATIDCGRPRRANDILSMENIENPVQQAALIRMLVSWAECEDKSKYSYKAVKMANARFLDEYNKWGDSTDFIYAARKVNGSTPDTFAFKILHMTNPIKYKEFINKLTSGLFTNPSDPVKVLYDLMLRNKVVGGAVPRTERVAVIFKAWNAFMNKKEIKRLSYGKSESFPCPITKAVSDTIEEMGLNVPVFSDKKKVANAK